MARSAVKTDSEGRPIWDKTAAQLIETVMRDAESEGQEVADYVVSTYDLAKEYDRRCARIYVQQQRDKRRAAEKETFQLLISGKLPGFTSATRPHDAQVQELTKQRKQTKGAEQVIEVIVDKQGKTQQVINHGLKLDDDKVNPRVHPAIEENWSKLTQDEQSARLVAFYYTMSKDYDKAEAMTKDYLSKQLTATEAPVTLVEETNTTTTPATMNYTTAHLNDSNLDQCLDDFLTYGDLLVYPVLQETGFDPETQRETYRVVRHGHALRAYAFLHYSNRHLGKDSPLADNFTAVILKKDSGKVKGNGCNTMLVCVQELRRLVPDTTFITPGSKQPAPAVVSVPVTDDDLVCDKQADIEAQVVADEAVDVSALVEAIATNYHKPLANIREAVLNYIADTANPIYAIIRKAKVGDVRAKAAAILVSHQVPLPAKASTKATKTKTEKAPAAAPAAKKATAKVPSADVIRAAAKEQGLDVSKANFRSSSIRAELAAKLNLM